jgi:uncharacterized protein
VAEHTEHPPGTPSWVDIGTDVEGAKAFYGELFGWESADAGPAEETGGYGFFSKEGKMVAGFGPKQDPGPPHWTTYVAVADADDTTQKVEAAGGNVVVAPMDVMGAGRMAVFQDTGGAHFSVWQAGEHRGVQLSQEPGTLAWVELSTRDPEGSKPFYESVFGWTAETHEGEMPYTEFHNDGPSVAGMMTMSEHVPAEVPPHWLVYFGVEDVDETVERAGGLGGEVVVAPTDVPDMLRFAVLRDPQGAVFGVLRGHEQAEEAATEE